MKKNNQETPLLSVIVPVYNTEEYLNRCMESITNQTYKNLDIVLVDDGSTDRSGQICDLWAKKDKRVKVCHKDNGGLVSARKEGVLLSKGIYIAHLDSDDWIELEMYEEMIQLATKNDADVVTSGIIRDYANHTVVEQEAILPGVYRGKHLREELWPNIVDVNHFFKTNLNIHITNKLFRRELLLKHQMELPNSVKIGEDAAVVYPVLFDATCIVVSGKCYYHYVIHQSSMMNAKSNSENGCDDIEHLFLKRIDEKSSNIMNIGQQLSTVIQYIRLFENPDKAIKIQDNRVVPFTNLVQGNKVIIYGAGRVGTRVHESLCKTDFCDVVGWCDKIVTGQVISLDDALSYNFDRIIIAILITDIADEVEKLLMDKGISKEQICRMGMNE